MTTMVWIYLIGVNLLAFALYGIDKGRAVKDRWRIPETTLLGVAFVGGSIGAWAGMQVFRHKTKHWRFKLLIPVFIVMHVGVLWYLVM